MKVHLIYFAFLFISSRIVSKALRLSSLMDLMLLVFILFKCSSILTAASSSLNASGSWFNIRLFVGLCSILSFTASISPDNLRMFLNVSFPAVLPLSYIVA